MELQPCHHTYQSLFYAMKSGFVYGQILTDSNEKPVNIRILEINPAFETMTSLYAKDVVGKTLLEFDPNMMSDSFPWIQIYGQAALMGESVEVEKYSSRFQSWFRIQAFSPKPGYFAAFVEDITQRKKIEIENTSNERRLQALIRVLQSPFDDIQSFLDNALNEAIHITGSKYGYIYLYHEESQELTLNTWSSGVLNDCNILNTNIVYTLKDTGFWGDVVRYQKTILDNQFQKSSPRKKGTPEGHVQIKKYLSIPVFFNNRIVAVVGVANKREDYTTTDELQLKLLMDSVWSIVENQQSGKEVEYQKTIQHNLAASLANSPLGMMYWKYSHGVATVLEWNPTAEEIFGWSANDIVGYSFTDKLYYPDDIEKAHLRIQELQKTKKSYHFQNRCYTKNNQILTIRWFVSYIKEESEGILYGMSLAENLTEIETAKQNVELIKKQFEYALEGSRAGSWDWYIDIDQLYVNNRWLEIFGFQEHQIATLGYASKMDFWGSRIHPKDAAFYKSELKNHLSKKTDYYRCEYRVLHKNGTWIWIEDRGKITQTSALGKPSRMSGTIQDISYQHDIYQDLEIRNSISSAFVEYPGYSVFSEVLRVILGITGNTKGVIGYFEEDQTCCIAAMSENLWEGDVYPFPIRLPYEDWKRTLWGKLLINGEEKPLGVYKITPLEGCKSLLQSIVIPIHYNDVMVGFFIVGDVSEKYTSNDFNIAQTIAKRMSPLFYPRLQFILNEERRYVAEQNLKASEEKLEMALDASNIGSWDWRMDTNTLLFDTRFMRILGYTEDAFKEQSITRWNQIVHPKDLDKDEGDIQKHFLGLKPYHGVDVQMKHRNGSWIWVTKRGKFTDFDSDGKPIQMNGTITEITHVKKAQLEAKAQKDELEWLVTGHQELLTKITAESLFQYIAATLSKKIPQSLILVLQASTDKKILHIKDFSTSSKTVKQTIAKWLVPHLSRYDIPITEDYQPIFSTQTLFEIPKSLWVQSMGFFSRTISQLFQNVLGMKKMYMIGLTGNKGQMGSVIVIQLDNAPLQNSKTIESFVYKASLVLERIMLETEEKASKVRLEQVTEQSKSIIWETDTDGRISYISSYVKELLGYAPEELIQWISWYDLHTENERSTMKELFEKKLQQGESFKNVFTELKKKDGTILYVSSNAVPIVTNDTIVGFRGADYDITLLKNMDQAKNEFINTVSHEMRTPLTVVKEANMILEMEALTSQQRKVLDISKKNIDRLSRIINDVLDYQKLQAKKVELVYQSIDLREFFQDIQESYMVVANKKNIQLDIQVRTKNPFLSIDEDKLYEVIGNLLDNAIKYTDKGSVKIRVYDKNSDTIRCTIKDTGVGIDKKELPKLFKVFSQTSTVSSRKTGSTGLGLAICKEIIELFQGSIWVDSKVGEGTTFTMDVPRKLSKKRE